ncbi:hypothetical protein ACFYYL_00350 [Actinomadura geliboluensis]|uniref:hypothetical protein n=1 Tax=Actinomadura geliboluensis TaxID=882440 RepID=UPI00369C5241
MSAAGGVLATHPLITAVPFFVPTFIVVAVIAVVVWRDRRRTDDEDTGNNEDTGDEGDGAGGVPPEP